MCWYRELGLATQLFLYGFDNVVRHERFPIVLSDVSVRDEAGLTAQVAGKLATIVVFHDDRVPRAFEDVENRIAVQWHEPANLEWTGQNALLRKNLAGFLDHSHSRTPADQGDIGISRAPQNRWRHRGFNTSNFPHPLFHHGAAVRRISKFIADQDSIFVVFVTRRGMGVPGSARDRTWGNAAFGNLVTLVGAVAIWCRAGGGDQFSAIDDGRKVQLLGINAEPSFRQQKIAQDDAGALEPVSDIKNLRDDFEAVSNIERCRDRTRIVAKSGAQHLPEVTLLGFGWNSRRRTGTLAVDYHYRRFHHGGQAQALGHQSKTAAGSGAHGANAGMGSADRHIHHANLVFHLPDHNVGLASVGRHPMQHSGRRAHGIGAIEFHARGRPAHRHRGVATEHGIAGPGHWKRPGKRLEIRSRVVISGPCDGDVFSHDGFAFFPELLGQNLLQRLEPDAHHAETR